ncbi:putrescine utilization regulator PtrR [Acerihabitans arboris]|uniref:LysR family transcriptional regulator n=1 Tax=Acerihabitans arboris TaxID=2691583 RepID=A0A845SP13_9GAMM|nr:LysR family transcriptional regulator [Acerihabitans arboris]NDL65809.1 LysR family transcriptional regulator [Acerihabitans arboris]
MDLTQLKMFCATAGTGSLARAAELLHRVPSNLTTRLRQLERELGADLFIREKQRLRLSPMGHNFLGYATRILALSEEAISMTHAGEPTGNFALGAMESTAAIRLPALLATYHQHFPRVSLSLVTGSSGDMLDGVRAGTLAAALVDGPVNYPEISSCFSFAETLVLIAALDQPPIDGPADIGGKTLFAFSPSCSYRRRFEGWFQNEGVAPGPILEIQSYHTMLACVASGAGVAMLPLAVLRQLPDRQRVSVHELPAETAAAATWLIWRAEAFSPNVAALKKFIMEQQPAAAGNGFAHNEVILENV